MSQFDGLAEVAAKKKIVNKPQTERKEKTVSNPPSEKSKSKSQAIGKSADDNFIQVGAYIKKETYIEVKKALLDEPEKMDFSDLIELRLQEWLKKRK